MEEERKVNKSRSRKKRNKTMVKSRILVILIICIIIFVIVMALNKKHEEIPENNNEIEEEEAFIESSIDMADLSNSEIRSDGLKINKSDVLAKGMVFNDTKVSDIRIESSGDTAVFTAEVTNDLGKDIEEYLIYITFYKKDGTVIDKVETLFPPLRDGETMQIMAASNKDIATAYNIEIERKIEDL